MLDIQLLHVAGMLDVLLLEVDPMLHVSRVLDVGRMLGVSRMLGILGLLRVAGMLLIAGGLGVVTGAPGGNSTDAPKEKKEGGEAEWIAHVG
jgi:hypothetical protein